MTQQFNSEYPSQTHSHTGPQETDRRAVSGGEESGATGWHLWGKG